MFQFARVLQIQCLDLSILVQSDGLRLQRSSSILFCVAYICNLIRPLTPPPPSSQQVPLLLLLFKCKTIKMLSKYCSPYRVELGFQIQVPDFILSLFSLCQLWPILTYYLNHLFGSYYSALYCLDFRNPCVKCVCFLPAFPDTGHVKVDQPNFLPALNCLVRV